jgi:integrase
VNVERRKAWVERRRMKTRKPLPVPLNDDAIAVLEECWREAPDPHWVFLNSKGTGPIDKLNDKDWKRMLRQAGIQDFRWHDLRHTWATWHVLSGTPLHELMMLGGWSTYEMVLRYAHMAAEHLATAADRVSMQRLREIQEELEVIEVA